MKSVIVSKFYSTLEKIGFKKHKISQEEIEYLNSLSKMDQFKAISKENNYNIERLRIKMNIFLLFATCCVLLSIYLITISSFLPMVVSILLFFTFLVFTKRYKTKMEILGLSKYVLNNIKKQVIEKSFK